MRHDPAGISGADTLTPQLPTGHFEGYFGTARHALLDLLDTPSPLRILEIGCGCGANLVEMKRRYPACRTTGVEIHPQAAAAAAATAGIDEVLQGDVLDEEGIRLAPAQFDVIILSHVLEHFAEPGSVLARCKEWSTRDARLLIALPNLRHALILKQLLVDGDFRYQDAGILDRTHLRFYTRRSAARMLDAEGLMVRRVAADIEGRRSRWLNSLSLGLAEEFSAFAYNFLATKA